MKTRTVYDIVVFTPTGSKVVASTWRCDYASFLLGEMVEEHCGAVLGQWSGAAIWREIAA